VHHLLLHHLLHLHRQHGGFQEHCQCLLLLLLLPLPQLPLMVRQL
jgi:hypothetical protein